MSVGKKKDKELFPRAEVLSRKRLDMHFKSKTQTKLRTTLPQNLRDLDKEISQGLNKQNLFTS